MGQTSKESVAGQEIRTSAGVYGGRIVPDGWRVIFGGLCATLGKDWGCDETGGDGDKFIDVTARREVVIQRIYYLRES